MTATPAKAFSGEAFQIDTAVSGSAHPPDYGFCFACDRRLRREGHAVLTHDGQAPWVGPECYRKILAAGSAGWQPPKGGPRLYIDP